MLLLAILPLPLPSLVFVFVAVTTGPGVLNMAPVDLPSSPGSAWALAPSYCPAYISAEPLYISRDHDGHIHTTGQSHLVLLCVTPQRSLSGKPVASGGVAQGVQ